MMKNLAAVFLAVLVFSLPAPSSLADGLETFDNSTATGSYLDNQFTGDNGVVWNFTQSRDESIYGIDGNGLMLRNLSSTSHCYSAGIELGIKDFSVDLRKGFTGAGNRQVALYINGISNTVSEAFDDTLVHVFAVSNINVSGVVTIDVRNVTEKQVVIDNIAWTSYDLIPGTPPTIARPPEPGAHDRRQQRIHHYRHRNRTEQRYDYVDRLRSAGGRHAHAKPDVRPLPRDRRIRLDPAVHGPGHRHFQRLG